MAKEEEGRWKRRKRRSWAREGLERRGRERLKLVSWVFRLMYIFLVGANAQRWGWRQM